MTTPLLVAACFFLIVLATALVCHHLTREDYP